MNVRVVHKAAGEAGNKLARFLIAATLVVLIGLVIFHEAKPEWVPGWLWDLRYKQAAQIE